MCLGPGLLLYLDTIFSAYIIVTIVDCETFSCSFESEIARPSVVHSSLRLRDIQLVVDSSLRLRDLQLLI